jgi:hypothetical protein
MDMVNVVSEPIFWVVVILFLTAAWWAIVFRKECGRLRVDLKNESQIKKLAEDSNEELVKKIDELKKADETFKARLLQILGRKALDEEGYNFENALTDVVKELVPGMEIPKREPAPKPKPASKPKPAPKAEPASEKKEKPDPKTEKTAEEEAAAEGSGD